MIIYSSRWPAVVSTDPDSLTHCRIKTLHVKGGPREVWDMHVSFVGETNRAWVDENRLKPFAGLEDLKEEGMKLVGHIKDKVERNAKKPLIQAYCPKSSIRLKWEASALSAEDLIPVDPDERLTKMQEMNERISRETKAQKRKRTETTEGESQDEDGSMPAAKRAKGTLRSMVEKEAEMASALVSNEPLNTKVITGLYLYTAGKREQLVCSSFNYALFPMEILIEIFHPHQCNIANHQFCPWFSIYCSLDEGWNGL